MKKGSVQTFFPFIIIQEIKASTDGWQSIVYQRK